MSMRSNKTINLIGAFATAAITTFGPIFPANAQQPSNLSTYPRSDCMLEAHPDKTVAVRFDEGFWNGKHLDSLMQREGNIMFVTIVPHGDSSPIPTFEFRNFFDRARLQVFGDGILLHKPDVIQHDFESMWKHINMCKGRDTLGAIYLLSPGLN